MYRAYGLSCVLKNGLADLLPKAKPDFPRFANKSLAQHCQNSVLPTQIVQSLWTCLGYSPFDSVTFEEFVRPARQYTVKIFDREVANDFMRFALFFLGSSWLLNSYVF